MSLIKVVWYVFRVKNMHPGSPSDPSETAAAEAKPRYVYSISKLHGQSFITSPDTVLQIQVYPKNNAPGVSKPPRVAKSDFLLILKIFLTLDDI